MRQRGQLARQARLRECIGDVLAPRARTHQAFAEAIGLTQLETHFFGCLLEARTTRVLRPERLNAQLFRSQILGAAREAVQDVRVLLLGVLDALGARLRRDVRGNSSTS